MKDATIIHMWESCRQLAWQNGMDLEVDLARINVKDMNDPLRSKFSSESLYEIRGFLMGYARALRKEEVA